MKDTTSKIALRVPFPTAASTAHCFLSLQISGYLQYLDKEHVAIKPMEQKFIYDALPVRVNTDEHNQLWFTGIDVCNILGYANANRTIKQLLDDDERYLEYLPGMSGQRRRGWKINEAGLYSLILSSTKPEAKAFKRWVTHEVLPAIRKAGIHSIDEAQEYEVLLRNTSLKLSDLRDQKASVQGQLRSIRVEIEAVTAELMHLIRTDYRQLKLKFPAEG
jgi:prophage antirepressor-like protein